MSAERPWLQHMPNADAWAVDLRIPGDAKTRDALKAAIIVQVKEGILRRCILPREYVQPPCISTTTERAFHVEVKRPRG